MINFANGYFIYTVPLVLQCHDIEINVLLLNKGVNATIKFNVSYNQQPIIIHALFEWLILMFPCN